MTKTKYNSSKKIGSYMGAMALGVIALMLPACNNPQEISEGRSNVTTEDITEATTGDGARTDNSTAIDESLVGQTVTVRSPVRETVDANGLVLETDSEPIPVINVSGVPFTPPAGEIPIQATGELVQFVVVDVEQEYGIDLNDELYVDYEQQLAIAATSLAPAPKPEDLAENAEPYYNQRIAVEGEAGTILSPNSFALYEEGWIDDVGLVVISVPENLESSASNLQEGEKVTVTGTVRPFDIDALQTEYGLDWDAQKISEFEARYTDRPVIIADEIYPSAVD